MRIWKVTLAVFGTALLILLVATLTATGVFAQTSPPSEELDAAYAQAHEDMRQSELGAYIVDWVQTEGLVVTYRPWACPETTVGYYSPSPWGVVLCSEDLYKDPKALRWTLSHEYLHAMFDAQCPDASLESDGWHEHDRVHLWQTALAITAGWDDAALYAYAQNVHEKSRPEGEYYDWHNCVI